MTFLVSSGYLECQITVRGDLRSMRLSLRYVLYFEGIQASVLGKVAVLETRHPRHRSGTMVARRSDQ